LLCTVCSIHGLQLTRATVSKIEAQLRCVTALGPVVLAEAPKVEVPTLLLQKPAFPP
jgi:hypothetical protein